MTAVARKQGMWRVIFVVMWVLSFSMLGAATGWTDGVKANNEKGRVVTNRLTSPPGIAYPRTAPGPTLLELNGLGVVFVSSCPDYILTAGTGVVFRNTSGTVLDAPGIEIQEVRTGERILNMFQPSQEGVLPIGEPAFSVSFQLGKGTGGGGGGIVATVTVSGLFDATQNVCRFNAQALINDK
jgi:hypothetical protein